MTPAPDWLWWLIVSGSIVLSAFGLYVLTASARRGDDLARQAERRARRDRALSPPALDCAERPKAILERQQVIKRRRTS